MTPRTRRDPHTLKARILAMMTLRVIVALAFLGATTWVQVTEHSISKLNLHPLYAVVVVVSLLTIFYARAINWTRNLRLFAYLQVCIDILLVTGIVYITGGLESYLQILYMLSIMGSSVLLGRRGGLFAASGASICYGLLVDMDFYGVLPVQFKVLTSVAAPSWEDVLTTVSTNILAFFTVAYLTGYLAEKTARVERKLEEKEIDFEKLERLNRQIVENISSGIMTLDEEMRITSFNKAAEAITGYTLRDVYYRKCETLFDGIFRNQAGGGGEEPRIERTFRRKDGEVLHLGFTVSVGQGAEAAHIVIFQDLTRLKAMEEQLRRGDRLRALGELSVGIAHEIRNPLASISGSVQVMNEDFRGTGDEKRLMDIVVRETDRLNTLITDFLLFARPANEKPETVDIASVVAEKVEIFRHSSEAAGIEIDLKLEEGSIVSGSSRQLGQVFWNLFINASQAMRVVDVARTRRRLLVWSSIETDPEVAGSTPKAVIKVIDTGCGMAPEDVPKVFDPFYSTKEMGTGLGLAIAHRIIESHGGTIEVRSRKGRGTSFTISLPLVEIAAPELPAVGAHA